MSLFKSLLETLSNLEEGVKDSVSSTINFYEIEGIAVNFIRNNQKKGLKNPLYLEVFVEKLSDSYVVSYIAYYKGSSTGKYINQEWKKEFSSIKNIPSLVETLLSKKGEVRVKIENILELFSDYQEESLHSIKFASVLQRLKKYQTEAENNGNRILSKKLVIEDKIFKTSVYYTFDTSKDKHLIKGDSFVEVTALPKDIAKVFNQKGKVEIEI